MEHLGVGLGKAFVKDAMKRSAQAANIAGMCALLVHATDDIARQWYPNWEFKPSASNQLHLLLLMKKIKAMAGKK